MSKTWFISLDSFITVEDDNFTEERVKEIAREVLTDWLERDEVPLEWTVATEEL